ncbi:MAG: helix-turn-helix transcriptional regulator [Chthoniobacterales bacterium]
MPAAATALLIEKSQPMSSERGSFGDLSKDGFRVTRWDDANGACGQQGFDANVLVLCLNVAGSGGFNVGSRISSLVEPGSMILSAAPRARQRLERKAGERHRFVVMEMSRAWVKRWMPSDAGVLRGPVGRFLKPGRGSEPACEAHAMTSQLAQLAAEVLQPPRAAAAWACWHHAKALEIVSHALFAGVESELFCDRTKRAGRERIARVQEILVGDVENPPSLTELGKMVGCSPFYLSRMFRQETGVTISAYLRRLRMDRAAKLIRAGEANVTEAAMTVGYSSLSHFSKAFAETFGCCPCLYGRKG